METPQFFNPPDRIQMKFLQGSAAVELIRDGPVHRFDTLTILAKQKKIGRTGMSEESCLFGPVVFGDRCHIEIVCEQDPFESEALSKPPVADFI